mmetsp:Transcript_8066/g.9258  ORF Transcript_8066/g.9258 Transcript_8066/m.9258 type:complete len:209 (+) Transcript_8066:310-936(+)|eukprot:CAMPEP_0184053866 /NCGR_PEP_ID=MMETSP0956-20121227/6237_1 /TAXON_ID=627963 /ORGANISM="Aplanochytrium sp, Strain PBS07" /LENGTH=208 /DNA_ID=CAMNT_0026347383 /DNA_START=305 /DNA_END=931 /DNA_ORIENTATION=+
MVDWYFRDMENKIQGPYSTADMHNWYVAGYLKSDLLISQNPQNGFNPLRDWFPNLQLAFTPGAEGAPGRHASPDANQLKWYFLDRSRNPQGPFTTDHMRQWFEQGYFEPTLQIYDSSKPENAPDGGWKVLREYFPNVQNAFLPNSPAAETPGLTRQASNGSASNASRFTFPDWLPVPPPYKGVKKIYPSEKANPSRGNVNDIYGNAVR